MSHRLSTAAVTLVIAVAPVLVPAAAAPAWAGGGTCHDGVTDERGTTDVVLSQLCFRPTVIRVDAGVTVRWVNVDGVDHTVTGSGLTFGTYDTVRAGQSVSYRFDRAGTFPYFCHLHPGMVGTVVVANGGTGSATVGRPIARPVARASGWDATSAGGLAAGAGVIGLGAGLRLRRRVRRGDGQPGSRPKNAASRA
jgi:plastocyanin